MPDYTLRVNGTSRTVRTDADTPLLYVLRNDFELNGAKFGYGLAQCGACTVHVGGRATRSCVMPVSSLAGKSITTLEGIGTIDKLHSLQKAFLDEQAAQCGYCTNGMIMSAKALLDAIPKPTDAQIKQALLGNLCRCGSHNRVVRGSTHRRQCEGSDGMSYLTRGPCRGIGSQANAASRQHDTCDIPTRDTAAAKMTTRTRRTFLKHGSATAAQKLNVAVDKLSMSDGAISASPVRLACWDLVKDIDLKRGATAAAKPKPPSQHEIIGKNLPRRDFPAKVTGGAAYVQDMRLPGMLFGRVVRPPSYRAQLVSMDGTAVKAMPGMVAVARDGNFLAVAAEREEQAIKAAQALRASAKWNETPDLPPGGTGSATGTALYEHPKKMPSWDSVIKTIMPASSSGGKITTIEAEYTRPFQAQGSIGPSCAVAQIKDGKYTVWTHSQGVFPLRNDLAKALRTPVANIICTHVEGSGCYGHNGADDAACDAALLARATSGRPVKLLWMREDEFGWEPYGSAMVMKMQAHLDESNSIVHWQHETWSHPHSTRTISRPDGSFVLGGWHLANPVPCTTPNNSPQPSGAADRNAVPLYDFPRQNILLHYLTDMPLRVSALRTLGAYANVFALESLMDETTLAAGADPVEFRLRHMKDPRARAVIELAAQKAGWKTNARGNGNQGRGIAFAKYINLAAYCAVVAEMSVDRNGNVKVTRAVSAVDAGLAINPDGIINQIEGGIIQSASWTLKEQTKFDRQRITTRSWADYPIFTFNDVPAVEVHLINRPDVRLLGVGEGSQGPTVAAIANAIANATGKRVRDLPLTADKLRTALT